MKPRYEVAGIIHRYGKTFLSKYRQNRQVLKTIDAIAKCRTAALGGHTCECNSCGAIKNFYNSCRNRHCPKCQAVNRERWIMQREKELLPVAYYHIVFTLPSELNELALQYPREVYHALFRASRDTIHDFAQDHKYLGAKTGMVAVLHTWGQQLWLHPHLHCIVPGGGITSSGKWKEAKYKGRYLFPKKAMSIVFRAKYVSALRKTGVAIPQPVAKALFQKQWVVYAKRPFASPKTVVEYLGRYTHKIAISNHRLRSIDSGKVSFTYKDYRKGGKELISSIDATEFLRRFCQHILPHGFVRMRHYGILASRNKSIDLNIAKAHFGIKKWEPVKIDWIDVAIERLSINPHQCPKCKKGVMEIVALIPPKRGPPDSECNSKLLVLYETAYS